MRKQIILGGILILISIILFSCNDDKEDNSSKNNPKTLHWSVKQIFAIVELENQTIADDVLITQIIDELKGKVLPLRASYNFTYDEHSNNEGKLIISFKESNEKITARFNLEANDDNTLLKLSIKYYDDKEEIHQILLPDFYMITDYTEEYKLLNPRIIKAEVIEKLTIPR